MAGSENHHGGLSYVVDISNMTDYVADLYSLLRTFLSYIPSTIRYLSSQHRRSCMARLLLI